MAHSKSKNACISCQHRKQRCDGGKPCFRCIKLAKVCEFSSTKPVPVPGDSDNKLDAILSVLQNLDARISQVEGNRADQDDSVKVEAPKESPMQTSPVAQISPNSHIPPVHSNGSTTHVSPAGPSEGQAHDRVMISQMSLNVSPMMAIKNIMNRGEPAKTKESTKISSPLRLLGELNSNGDAWTTDPVSLNILNINQAQQLVNIYFESCHPMAPLLTKEIFQDASIVRGQSTLLFLTILSVACRFAPTSMIHSSVYSDLILLLDYHISQIVLYSTDEVNAELEVMEAFQIYAHWMPISKRVPFGKRSAWNMIGLAIRWSKCIGLENRVSGAFSNLNANPTKADFRNLRVLLNLISLDYQFMLSSRRPVSIDPTPFVPIGKKYMLHPNSNPEDVKLIALSELALIFHSAFDQSGISGKLDWSSLSLLNFRLDEWESNWKHAFDGHVSLRLNLAQIPFTSLRWYRLALNTLPLRLLFSADNAIPPLNNHGLECLNRSINSAAEMLACFLTHKEKESVQLDRKDFVNNQWTNYVVNAKLVSNFRFSIDSYWISHVFAISFLCVLYSRGIINDNCECLITMENASAFVSTTQPIAPSTSSLLVKLLGVGREIFSSSNYLNSWWHQHLSGLAEIVNDIYDSMMQCTTMPNSAVNEIFDIPVNMVVDWDSVLASYSTSAFGEAPFG